MPGGVWKAEVCAPALPDPTEVTGALPGVQCVGDIPQAPALLQPPAHADPWPLLSFPGDQRMPQGSAKSLRRHLQSSK